MEDNNLPAREICLKCHEKPQIGQPRSTLLSRFSHQTHARLPNVAPLLARAIQTRSYLGRAEEIRGQLATSNACAGCHLGIEQSEAPSKANFPRMADCLVCHSTVDPPFSCEFCHAREAKLKPASHTADFLDSHTTGKLKLDKSSCAVCHGRKFTCLGCH